MYETIFSPVNYGGLELKNRIIFAPTTFGLSDEEYFAKIRAIAAGGCAMIIVGDVPVGKSRFEKSLFDKKGFAWYQSLAEIVHSCGCKLCAQLHQSDSNMAAMLKYVPGVLTKKITMQQLRTLLNEEVAPPRLRRGRRAGGKSRVRHGADPRRPHVRQFQLQRVQPPHRCLRRQRRKPRPLCR